MPSRINDIVEEFEVIANAFESVETFIFGYNSDINDDVSKSYPVILLSSAVSATSLRSDSNSFLPREKNYDIQITFWDTFQLSEQKDNTIETKFAGLEIIADQYLAEFMDRTAEGGADFYIENYNTLLGSMVRNEHNGMLVGIRYNMTIHCDNVGCTVGAFTY